MNAASTEGAFPDINPTMMHLGMEYGKKILSKAPEETQRSLFTPIAALRPYFQTTDTEVLKTMQRLFLPFVFSTERDELIYSLDSERQRLPDLYFPLMATMTHSILASFLSLATSEPRPDLLHYNILMIGFYVLLEVIIIKISSYTFAERPFNWLDLVSWCGHKQALVCVLLLSHFVLRNTMFIIVLLIWTTICGIFYMFRTLQEHFRATNFSNNHPTGFVYSIAAVQAPILFWYYWRLTCNVHT